MTWRRMLWSAAPTGIVMLVAFILPMLTLVLLSFSIDRLEISPADGILTDLTTRHYLALLRSPFALSAYLRTVLISLAVVAISAALAYPICVHLLTSRGAMRAVITMLALGPLLISVVVRTFGWIILLGPGAIVDNLTGLQLLRSDGAVILGLIHLFHVFMVLSIMSTLSAIPNDLANAARTLGSSDWDVFRRVLLPMSLPGLISGSVIVFGVSAGAIVTPVLLGGPSTHLAASEIYRQITSYGNWPLGAAMSVGLLVVNFVAIVALQRLLAIALGGQWLKSEATP